jgi:hypothetical protein
MERRFPSLMAARYGGYSTDGKDGFDNSVEFVFDYSNVDTTVRDVKKQLSDLSLKIDKTFSKSGIPTSKTGGGMFYLSPQIKSVSTSKGGVFGRTIEFLPDGNRIRDSLAPAMAQIGAEGKATMKKYANRIDTGLMRGSIIYRTNKTKNSFSVRIGWLDIWYKYFGFQENGTRNVPAMRSSYRTYLEMLPRVRAFADRLLRSYKRTGKNAGGASYK